MKEEGSCTSRSMWKPSRCTWNVADIHTRKRGNLCRTKRKFTLARQRIVISDNRVYWPESKVRKYSKKGGTANNSNLTPPYINANVDNYTPRYHLEISKWNRLMWLVILHQLIDTDMNWDVRCTALLTKKIGGRYYEKSVYFCTKLGTELAHNPPGPWTMPTFCKYVNYSHLFTTDWNCTCTPGGWKSIRTFLLLTHAFLYPPGYTWGYPRDNAPPSVLSLG